MKDVRRDIVSTDLKKDIAPTVDWNISRYSLEGQREEHADRVAVERPLEITVNGGPLVSLMRLPGMDDELAVGFCLTERVIKDISQVRLIAYRDMPSATNGGNVNGQGQVLELDLESPQERQHYSTPYQVCAGRSGVGSSAIDDLCEGQITSRLRVRESVLYGLGDKLTSGQEIFQDTAGAHGAGVFTPSGELVVATEDVGRHNALDKAVGWCAMHGIPLTDKILFNSGRISCAMTLKTVRMGIPVMVSMAAVTSLVLSVADRAGLTVIGFSNGRRFSVYTHPERIVS